jgi:ribose 5-phosphate isomerase B
MPETNMIELKIAIASDHAGYDYKVKIKEHLVSRGYEVRDFGTDSGASVDYPRFIRPAADAVALGECDRGIILGGSGNGEAIVANKVKGIRCAVCWNMESAKLAKEHNNANIISLGQRMMSADTALEIVDMWLSASFEGGRHEKRINQIERME